MSFCGRGQLKGESAMQHKELFRNKDFYFQVSFHLFCFLLFFEQEALANRLVQAASSATSSMMTLAQATSGVAFALGAIMYHFGASQAGRQILIGGVIGLSATFGGPAIIELLRGIFRA